MNAVTDRIAFTGSTVTGREIVKASAVNMRRRLDQQHQDYKNDAWHRGGSGLGQLLRSGRPGGRVQRVQG